jgi:hypothetical protein
MDEFTGFFDQEFVMFREEEEDDGIEMFQKIECSSLQEDPLEGGEHTNTPMSTMEEMGQEIFVFNISNPQDPEAHVMKTTVNAKAKQSGKKTKRTTIRKFSKVPKKTSQVKTKATATTANTTNAIATTTTTTTNATTTTAIATNAPRRRHRRSIVQNTSTFKCTSCTATFEKMSSLIKHMHSHKAKYGGTCPCCGKFFTQHINMETHYNAVHKNVKYTCKICTAQLSSMANLIHHQRTHSKKKTVQCKKCKIWLKGDVARHMETKTCKTMAIALEYSLKTAAKTT